MPQFQPGLLLLVHLVSVSVIQPGIFIKQVSLVIKPVEDDFFVDVSVWCSASGEGFEAV